MAFYLAKYSNSCLPFWHTWRDPSRSFASTQDSYKAWQFCQITHSHVSCFFTSRNKYRERGEADRSVMRILYNCPPLSPLSASLPPSRWLSSLPSLHLHSFTYTLGNWSVLPASWSFFYHELEGLGGCGIVGSIVPRPPTSHQLLPWLPCHPPPTWGGQQPTQLTIHNFTYFTTLLQ